MKTIIVVGLLVLGALVAAPAATASQVNQCTTGLPAQACVNVFVADECTGAETCTISGDVSVTG